jgi:hypothetical protein
VAEEDLNYFHHKLGEIIEFIKANVHLINITQNENVSPNNEEFK